MARVALIVATVVALAFPVHFANAGLARLVPSELDESESHISPLLSDLSKYVSRLIAQEQAKTTDSMDDVPNVIEVVAEATEDTGDSDVSVGQASESTASVTTTASNLPPPVTTIASDKSYHGKASNSNNNNNNGNSNSSGHGAKVASGGHIKVDKLSKCLSYCQSTGKKATNDGPCNRGCLFRQLLDILIKESSLKDPKDVSLLCAKACIGVYSSESSALTQCLKGCNNPNHDKSIQGKQANKGPGKSHSKVKLDVSKKLSKNFHETPAPKAKGTVGKDGASSSSSSSSSSPPLSSPSSSSSSSLRFPFMSNFLLPPVQLHYLFTSKSVVDDSKEQVTTDTNSKPRGTLIDSQGKQFELPGPFSIPKFNSQFDSPLHASPSSSSVNNLDSPLTNRRPLEPIDLIQRIFSKSLLLPQSTFHFIKSTITYVTDEGNDSNETNNNQKPSPIPVDDSISQFKTTDSVYSDPSELNIMEPRVIMFGETDQEPFPEFHGITHIYKSPARTTLYKIWDCLKASLTMKHLRLSISLLMSFAIVFLFIIMAMLFIGKGMNHPRSNYSRVPTSDPTAGGKSGQKNRFDRSRVTYEKKANTSDGENGCLLDSEDDSSNGSNELQPQLVILNNHCPPSYEEAQKDNSRLSRSLLVAIDVPIPGNSENVTQPGHPNDKLIV